MNETAYLILLGAFLTVIVYSIRDGFLFWVLIRRSTGSGGTVVTVPPVTGPPPIVLPPPAPPEPRFTEITATSFGGRGDTQPSAYGGMVQPDVPGYSLPGRINPDRRMRVFFAKRTVDCGRADVGPWNTNDPYWETGARPAAEAEYANKTRAQNGRVPTNTAGLDLTPGAWVKLGLSQDEALAAKETVSWDWVDTLDGAATPPTTAPAGNAPWVTLGRTYDGLVWNSGPMPAQIVAWLDAIATKFPEMVPYCAALKTAGRNEWFAWCGFYVQAMLAPFGIRGPISAAGLTGETTTADWAYVDAWKTWGDKVWGPEDGSINDAQPQVGDVLVWYVPNVIHHVSFYGKPLPDTDTFDSLGGDQGKPLRVCEEEISMSYCVAIRRRPVA